MAVNTSESVKTAKRPIRRKDAAKLTKVRRGGFIAGLDAPSPLQTGGCCGAPAGALAGEAVASGCCGEPIGSGGASTAGGCCGEPTLVASNQPHVASQGCCGEAAGNCCG
jgi:hypothetical protein